MQPRSRRWYAPTVLALLATGGVAFLATSRVWVEGRVVAEGLPADPVSVTGSDAHPLVTALSVVIVAASLAILSTGGRTRRVVGVIAALAALGGLAVVAFGGAQLDRSFADAVAASTAFTGQNPPEESRVIWWPVLTVLALLIAAGLGALTACVGHTWPTMGRRYEAPTAAAPQAPQTESDIRKALDEGRDPTE